MAQTKLEGMVSSRSRLGRGRTAIGKTCDHKTGANSSGEEESSLGCQKPRDEEGCTLRTVITARPLALERTEGGMTLSGPNACRGSTKLHAHSVSPWQSTETGDRDQYEARILPTFLDTFALAPQTYQ